MTRGKLVVLEGIDGAGTTTQAERLAIAIGAHRTREPSDGPIGVFIREVLRGQHAPFDARALALAFAADRLDHVAREIEPILARGQHVVSDRYVLSSYVYQGRFIDLDFVRAINAAAPPADVTILLDLPADTAAARRQARGGPDELYDALELQRTLAERYRAEAARLDRVVVLDGAGDRDAVFAAVLAAARACIAAG